MRHLPVYRANLLQKAPNLGSARWASHRFTSTAIGLQNLPSYRAYLLSPLKAAACGSTATPNALNATHLAMSAGYSAGSKLKDIYIFCVPFFSSSHRERESVQRENIDETRRAEAILDEFMDPTYPDTKRKEACTWGDKQRHL